MSKEEIDKWLDEEYGCSYTRLEELHDFYFEKYTDLQQENKQLKEVIEEVREWLKYKAEALDEFDIPKRKETGAFWFSTRGEIDNLLQILDKVKDAK